MKQPVIAIDGPAGAGKSTIAKLLAKKLNFLYIDTGAMYRALAYKAIKLCIDSKDQEKIADLATETKIVLTVTPNGKKCVLLDGEDVTKAIRTPEVTMLVSSVAMIPAVRINLVKHQREMAAAGGVVMDGRDIGTYVLPDAELKFFLTASLEERAKRRYLELVSQGFNVQLKDISNELLVRDSMDENRALAPLKQAQDAILIDTTNFSIEDVLDTMTSYWSEK